MPKRGLTLINGERAYDFAGECRAVYRETLNRKLAHKLAVARTAKLKEDMDKALEVLWMLCEAAKGLQTSVCFSNVEPGVIKILREEGLTVDLDVEAGNWFRVSFQPPSDTK